MNQKPIAILAILLLLTVNAAAGAVQISTVTYTPAPAAPGQLITVWVTLKNNSQNIAQQVTVEPQPAYPFTLSATGNNMLSFDAIAPFQTVTGKLEIEIDKQALNGTCPLEIRAAETGGMGGVSSVLQIRVISYKPQIELITADLPSVEAGQTVNTMITIKNIGSSGAINVLVGTFDNAASTTTSTFPIKNIGPTLIYVDALGPNETKQIPMMFGVDPTAEQKTHLVPITIKYQDENRSDFSVTRYLGMRVQSDAELDAYLTYEDTAKPTPGATTEITVNLFNRGAATARNIVVQVEDSPSIDILSESKVFIGTLDPDDFDSFKLNAHIKNDLAPGKTYPIRLRFEFKNQDNQTQVIQKDLNLNVFDANLANGGTQTGFPWDLVVIVIVLAVIGYFGYKRFFGKKTGK